MPHGSGTRDQGAFLADYSRGGNGFQIKFRGHPGSGKWYWGRSRGKRCLAASPRGLKARLPRTRRGTPDAGSVLGVERSNMAKMVSNIANWGVPGQ
jgi:hypothetical protein